MAKKKTPSNTPPEAVISIIGAGMTIEGDSDTDGSLRVEGTILGNVRARKSVVIGRDGLVDGSIYTQDAVIAGRVLGGIHAVSRLELQKTSEVLGEIEAPRMQVEEGAKVQGQVAVGESALEASFQPAKPQTSTGGGKGEPKTEPVESQGSGESDESVESEGRKGLEESAKLEKFEEGQQEHSYS